jgi:glycerol kinase
MRQILAIDQGTHATRAIVFDGQGREVASAQQAVMLHRHSRSEVEQDATEILVSMRSVITEVLAAPGVNAGDIGGVGLATQRSSVVAWNRVTGAALSPVLSWQDRRNESLITALAAHEDVIQQKTGLRLSAHYGASKLRWLLEQEPVVARAREAGELLLGPLVSWLLFHLIEGNPARVDHANASRTLLWNLHTRDWDRELLELFKVPPGVLPACHPICAEYGVTRPGRIPLRAVNGDQSAALYAQGRPEPGTIIVNIGTGAFVLLPVRDVTLRPDGLLAGISHSNTQHADYYLEGTVNGAGAALEWAAERLGMSQAAQHLAGQHGLHAPPAAAQPGMSHTEQHLSGWLAAVDDPPLFINTVGGLGAPWWKPGPEPHYTSTPASPAHAMVAVLESILFLVQANIALLRAHASDIHCIQISGGLANLDGLCQKLADLSGLLVQRPAQVEATARGIAWQAAGGPPDWLVTGLTKTFQPRSNSSLHARYRRFIDALKQQL